MKKRVLAWLLTLLMCLSLLPIGALADEEAAMEEEISEIVEVVESEESAEPEDPAETEEPAEEEAPAETEDVVVEEAQNAGSIPINETTFPDATFRAYVSKNCDTDSDGSLSSTEIANVTVINVNYMGIANLKGVEYFTALKTLYCYKNKLTSLDVSGCTALEILYCDNNKLTSLNVSGCTALETLYCYSNQLTSLNVSGCTALHGLFCYSNQLTSLNVSGCTALEILSCSNNQLTSLDVSKNMMLRYLHCYDNQLTSLNVSGCTALEILSCSNNQLTSLNVSGCTALQGLSCYSNQLTSLDVSKNMMLRYLHCYDNQLTSLDVSKNAALVELYCADNQLTSLDVSKNTELVELYCYDNQLTSLDVSNNTALVEWYCSDNTYAITVGTNRQFDLTTIPGSFNVTKASGWSGGTVSGNILTVNSGAEEVTYTYDCGQNKSETFRLIVEESAPVTYTVSFDAKGGSGAPSAQAKTAGQTLTLSSTRPTRAGYSFLGWATSATATSASYQPGGEYTEDSDVTLYAVWSEIIVPFTDVKNTAWYAPFVCEAVERGLMNGMGNNQFSPKSTASRAMIVQILYNMNGKPSVTGSNPFTDVSEKAWYFNAVQWAYSNSITSGVSAVSFAPNTAVTREQIAKFLYSYAGAPAVEGSLIGFEDSDKVSGWAMDAVIWATQNDIINGSLEDGKLYLNPRKSATRAETAKMMVRFSEIVG